MLEKYWRNVGIRKVTQNTPRGEHQEYLIYYRKNLWRYDVQFEDANSRLAVIETVRKIPHKKRIYIGFDPDDENELERLINKRVRKH